MYNALGRTGTVRHWTIDAINCYKRGCVCDECFFKTFFTNKSEKCKMKASVLELVRIFGIPKKENL